MTLFSTFGRPYEVRPATKELSAVLSTELTSRQDSIKVMHQN